MPYHHQQIVQSFFLSLPIFPFVLILEEHPKNYSETSSSLPQALHERIFQILCELHPDRTEGINQDRNTIENLINELTNEE
jgi:hypothetical protein